MDTRTKIGLLLIVYAVHAAVCAPRTQSKAVDPANTVRRSKDVETGRIFWSPLGDILAQLPFLPFTVNVPDAISAFWGFVSAPFTGSTSSSGNQKPAGNNSGDTGITRDDLIDYFLY